MSSILSKRIFCQVPAHFVVSREIKGNVPWKLIKGVVFPLALYSVFPYNKCSANSFLQKDNRAFLTVKSGESALNPAFTILRCIWRGLYLITLWIPSLTAFAVSPLFRFILPSSSYLYLQEAWWRYNLMAARASGATLIKFLQWASTRKDLFSPDFCSRFSHLHDNVSNIPFRRVKYVMDQDFPDWQENLRIEEESIGSGCIASVYKGILSTDSGRFDIAVKIVQPGVKRNIKADLELLKWGAWVLECIPGLKWCSFLDSVKQFEALMMQQIDMRVEAKHLNMFRCNFKESLEIRFPKPYDDFVSEHVLVESFQEGMKMKEIVSNDDFLEDRQRRHIADLGVHSLLKMIFIDNLVHADLHPGNMLVDGDSLVFLDAGIVASLSENDRQNLMDLFVAIVMRDGMKAGRLFVERSKENECPDVELFAYEIDALVQRALSTDLKLKNIQLGDLLGTLLLLCSKHKVKLDANFASIMVSLIMIEGVGRALNPDLNILYAAMPIIMRKAF